MKYIMEIESLAQFEAWQGGLETLHSVLERGGIDELTNLCEDVFSGSTPTETEINDWLWFESDFIYKSLGYVDLLD